MKKLLRWLLCAIMLLPALATPVAAATEKTDDGLYYKISGGKAVITDCDESLSGDLTIPEEIDGYPVTCIGRRAFYDCDNLTSITIPSGVMNIGSLFYRSYASGSNLELSESKKNVEYEVFDGCGSLKSIEVSSDNSSYCSIDGVLYSKDKTRLIRCPEGKTGDYIIPAEVKSIGENAFYRCRSLTGITLPNGVTSIRNNTFYACGSLKSITLPDSVTSIGNYAFFSCGSLTSITFSGNITSIGECAFYDCNKLASVTLLGGVTSADYISDINLESIEVSPDNPSYCSVDGVLFNKEQTELIHCVRGKTGDYIVPDGVTSIGDSAFYCCSSLTGITLPDSVTSIGSWAFSNCSSLTSIMLPDSVTSIGNGTFRQCSSLTSITLPDGVTSIGNFAFYNCDGLTSITLPSGVTSIGESAFDDCDSLTSITLSDSVTSIGDYAFYDCSSLTSITFSGNVTSIGYFAFSCCSSLTNITLSGNITSIVNPAFWGCYKLTSITLLAGVTNIDGNILRSFDNLKSIEVSSDNSSYCSVDGVLYSKDKTRLIWCPGEKNGDYTVPDGVTSIGNSAFSGCSSLTSITLPDSVTSIGNSAFSGCSSLTSITLPDSVTSIGNSAFYDCSGLKSITLPDSVTSIGNSAFSNCSSLTSIMLPDSVTSIGNGTFHQCSSLTSITIPDSVTSIGNSAFSGCSSLTSITLPDSVTSIGNSVFSECNSLTSIALPNSVRSIGESAFWGCSSLTSITLPSGLTSIGHSVFSCCDSLTSIMFSGNVTSIDDYAFGWYNKLTSITLLGGVTSIDSNIFSSFDDLESIEVSSDNPSYCSIDGVLFSKDKTKLIRCPQGKTGDYIIPNSVTSIDDSAFMGCSDLTSITLPDSVTSIGSGFFNRFDNLENIKVSSDNPSYCIVDGAVFNKNKTELIWCSGDKTGDYTVPDGVTSIREYAFYNCDSLTSVTLPAGLTNIGESAFYDCDNLTSVTLSTGLTNIGLSALEDRSSLTSIILSAGLTGIGESAFCDCDSLTSVTLPIGVTSIGDSAFSGCDSLANITFPDSVTSIGDYAFRNCDGLTSITLPIGLTSIGDSAFSGCDGLTNIMLPAGVTSIGDHAFSSCDGLASITFPDSLTSIGEGAFSYCNSLTGIILPNRVMNIGERAFFACYHLTKITVLNRRVDIGECAFIFDGCEKLTIYGYSGSTAEEYATKHNIPFALSEEFSEPEIPLQGIALDKTSLTLVEEESGSLTVTFDPADATNQYVSWESSDEGVAKVENGKISAVSPGTAKITVTALDEDYTATCTVTVTHKEVIDKAVAATCTKDGLTEGKHCSECGEVLVKQEVVKALGHSWDGGVVTKKATTTETGVKTYTCTRCGATYTETIAKLPLTIVFDDVTSGTDWFAPYVNDLVSQGILNGKGTRADGTPYFEPLGLITRGEFSKILATASGDDLTVYNGYSKLSDTAGHWALPYINWAYEKGIVTGFPDGTFAPDASITREQMAVMICRYAEYKGISLPAVNDKAVFTDGNLITWSADAVYAMQQAGIINGYNENGGYSFKPQGNATRAEAATMISRFLSL